jgi:hypothetical protein
MFARYLNCQDIARHSLGQRDQCPSMIFADHGVTLPVAYTAFLSHNLWALFNTYPVPYCTSSLLSACITLATRLLATQLLPQVTSATIVGIDVLVDGLMTDL